MNNVPAQVGAPKAPQVNLLPPDVGERRAAGRARRMMMVLVAAFTLLVVGAWYYVTTLKQAADDNLTAEESRTPAKQKELASYSYLPALRAQVDQAVLARALAGSTDIIWTDQLQALFSAFPSSMALKTLEISQTGPSSPLTLDGGVFDVPDYGSVTFQATSTVPVDAAALIERLNALPGFERSWVDAVELAPDKDDGVARWSVTGLVRITEFALSGRTETTQKIVPIEESATDQAPAGDTTDQEG